MQLTASFGPILAQMAPMAGGPWSFGQILITIIVVAACLGILLIACRVMGIEIPQWAWQIFWIVVVAVVAIFAIKFLLGM